MLPARDPTSFPGEGGKPLTALCWPALVCLHSSCPAEDPPSSSGSAVRKMASTPAARFPPPPDGSFAPLGVGIMSRRRKNGEQSRSGQQPHTHTQSHELTRTQTERKEKETDVSQSRLTERQVLFGVFAPAQEKQQEGVQDRIPFVFRINNLVAVMATQNVCAAHGFRHHKKSSQQGRAANN